MPTNLRVLILDDIEAVRECHKVIVRSTLRNPVFLEFDNGDDAWREIVRDVPDLLITDISHVGMSCEEMLCRLATMRAHLPVLVVSSILETSPLPRRNWQGLDVSFHAKPFECEPLVERIERAIALRVANLIPRTPLIDSWSVSYLEDGKRHALPYLNADEAMRDALELSQEPNRRKQTVIVSQNHLKAPSVIIAEFQNGVEQLEKLALDSIVLDCKIFAEYQGRADRSPTAVWGALGACIAVGAVFLATSATGEAFSTVCGVTAGLAVLVILACVAYQGYGPRARDRDEALRWAREIVHRVMFRTPPELRERILKRRRTDPPRGLTEEIADKFGDETKTLEHRGCE